jgi:membrane protease YdiL (CAAX protease family)
VKRTLLALLQVLAYLLAIFSVVALAVIPTKIIFGDLEAIEIRLEILLMGIQAMLAVIVVNAFLVRVRKSMLVRVGWPTLSRSVRWFGIGLMIGVLLGAGVLVIIWLSGGGRLEINGDGWSRYIRYVLPLLCGLLIAALAEEWIFRGYPLAKLSSVAGPMVSNVIVGILFMACHWGSDGWTVLAAVNILLFSLVNGAMRFTPGGIPAAWGFHFAWNGLYVLLGANLSGTNYEVPAVRLVGAGPAWMSGGAYGPEGAIGTTVMTAVALMLIWKYLRRRPFV